MTWTDDERLTTLAGVVIAALGPIVVALLLVPVRPEVNSANLALILVLVVVIAAIVGGRWAGAVAAISATLSFDFFLVKPYLSLKIETSDDVETALILLGVGLLVGAVASRGRRAVRQRDQAALTIARVHHIADLVAQGASLNDLVDAVTRELRQLLSLQDCWLEFNPFLYVMPRLERGGSIEASEYRWLAGGLSLSEDGVELPVLERGTEVARLVLVGDPTVAVTIEERVAAVALADQLGSALALAEPGTRAAFEEQFRRERRGRNVVLEVLKRVLVGRPLASTQMEEQRLPKTIALAVFSSDALSSTAYATEEILFVVAVGGSSLALGLSKLVPISIVVAALLAIVIASYRQVIFAYPGGGGAYAVSKENFGEIASLVAGASLMVDYILTVAVSISAGVAAIISIPEFSSLAEHRVELGVGLIILITLMNMRGIKESGRVFVVPTYLYMLIFGVLIIYGLYQSFFGNSGTIPYDPELTETSAEVGGTLTLFLLLKGFSSGAVALTGVEAISNGVPAFRRPEAKNAATTLVWMGVLLGSMFFGISLLADRLHPYPSEERTVIAQLGLHVFGNGPLFVLLQFATAAILVLAANTAYNGFPSLSSIIAIDGYLPRQLQNRGDRLVFSNGIIVLAGAAALLVIAFGGITTALIPLYAVGVFTSFTLSQSGMVRHHLLGRQPRWRRSVVVNAVGAVATFVVLLIVATTKFTSGAWLPLAVIPAIVILFKLIKRHYTSVNESLQVPPGYRPPRKRLTMVVLVEELDAGVLDALAYGTSIAPDNFVAATVVSTVDQAQSIEKEWSEYGIRVPLELVHSASGEFTAPMLAYVDELQHRWPNAIVNVIIPELYVEHWWQHLLHNQTALVLKGKLLFRDSSVVVTSIPYSYTEPAEAGYGRDA